jgi:exopolysaccharide biosynthesis predicted pyruvyltransferase EpsI
MIKNKPRNKKELQTLLHETLRKEIAGRVCCLLDLPNYYNPGDQLIWEGEEQILKKIGVKVRYRASLHFFNKDMVKQGDCILLQGGGNFGDLYYKHQQFREYIVTNFPNHKIIILPSTIYFSSAAKLRQSFSVFAKHKQLVICARDERSYKLLVENIPQVKAYLLPDTAYGIENIGQTPPKFPSKKILYLSRTDKELKNDSKGLAIGTSENVDKSDWPYFIPALLALHVVILKLNIFLLSIWKLVATHWNSKYDVHGIIPIHSRPQQIKDAVRLISNYGLIVTSRLHGHILSTILDIPSIVIDNSYGKNKNYYDTWNKGIAFTVPHICSTQSIDQIMQKHLRSFKKR